MSSQIGSVKVSEPLYYHREYKNDILQKPSEENKECSSWAHTAQRVAFTALPFFSLYKPLSFPISLLMGGLRTYTSITQLMESIKRGDTKDTSLAMIQTAVAVIALAGTIFAHPLGMLISSGYDLAVEAYQLIENLRKGDYEKAAINCLGIINNALYLTLFLSGGWEIAIASLAMQILIGLYHSQDEFKKGHYIEGMGHLLMSMVRGNQLGGQVKALQLRKRFEEMLTVLKTHEEQASQESKKLSLSAVHGKRTTTLVNTTPVGNKLTPIISTKLLAMGADPEFIEVLMKYRNLSNATNARDIRAATLFLKNGANPNERSNLGYAEHHYSISNVSVNEGMTSLDIATRTGNTEMAILLLQFGADPTVLRKVDFNLRTIPSYRDKNLDEPYIGYMSPVYVAIKNKNYALLEAFLRYRADFNKVCFINSQILDMKYGKTPLNIAISEADAKAAAILVNGGAKP